MARHSGTSRIGRPARALALLLAVALIGCGTAEDRDQARSAAESLYAAVRAQDGAGACRELSQSAREELEGQEETPCEEAVLDLDLQGSLAERVEVYVTEAAVHLAGGDTVFLGETPQGWRVSAFGCQGQRPDTPADCELQA